MRHNPYKIVKMFEETVADYTGAPFAVSTDNCTDAILLCCEYLNVTDVTIPSKTYLSVPQSIMHAGGTVKFKDYKWKGIYQLEPYPIWDAAKRFTSDMYIPGSYQCVSFHHRKILKIGKGGMIFTDDEEAYEWFKIARYEGRNLKVPYEEDDHKILGWNMYMTPEQAARGLILFEDIELENDDTGGDWAYKDLSGYDIFKK